MGAILIQTIRPNQLKGGRGSLKKLPFYDQILSDGLAAVVPHKGWKPFLPYYIS